MLSPRDADKSRMRDECSRPTSLHSEIIGNLFDSGLLNILMFHTFSS